MRLNPNRRLTNRSRGEHLSGRGGTSTEFTDYRNYVPGDDIRHVDWNIFARLQRPYLKQFRHEEEMHVVILVDASASMQCAGKFELAKKIAGAFGVMGLLNVERISVVSCGHQGTRPQILPPCTGRASTRRLFDFVEGLQGGGDYPVEKAIETVLRVHRGRGIAAVLSDFLTFGDLHRAFNLLYSAGLELFAVQILAPQEIDPEIAGDVRFVDSETGRTLDISSAADLLGIYHEHRRQLEDDLNLLCRQRNGRFLSVRSDTPLDEVLFNMMSRGGWVVN